MKVKDLTGQKFGKLTALSLREVYKGHAYWHCQCECGNYKAVRGSHLKSGNVASCGCVPGRRTHGESKTRLYHIWAGMRDRCFNQKHIQYIDYGGRGIQVCKDWLDFVPFRDWAISHGYEDGLSIDRIDNDGNYCPENCRWTTAKVQSNNTRRNRVISYNGETHTVSEWAEKLGIKQSTLSMRINKYGWSVEKALGKEIENYGT